MDETSPEGMDEPPEEPEQQQDHDQRPEHESLLMRVQPVQ
jgi:hypothetical protein